MTVENISVNFHKRMLPDPVGIYLHESYVAELGFELGIPGYAVTCATDCTMEPDSEPYVSREKLGFSISLLFD